MAGVLSAIEKLSVDSANYDHMPARAIKDCAEPVAKVLAKLIDISVSQGHYPRCLKRTKILPIFKKGNPSVPSNYRPISLIPLFAKVFERVVYDTVLAYFNQNHLFSSTQYGFRPGHSTTQACADLIDSVSKLVDRGYTVAILILDVTKAFDTVDHTLLLRKMLYYGFGTSVVKWFSSYLANRTALVQIGEHTADYSALHVGVPQGSVLGPFLYNIYVNDLAGAAYGCRLMQYADDTCLMVKTRKDALHLQRKIENASSKILDWFKSNKLSINTTKSKLIVFGRCRKEIKTVHIGAQDITPSDCVTYLGLRIDPGLTWHNHIQYVISRVKQFKRLLWKFNGAFDAKLRNHLAKTLILPVISLYDFIYSTANIRDLHYLDVAYNDLMRSVLGFRRSAHVPIKELHSLTSFSTLEDNRNHSLVSFITKIVNDRMFSTFRSDCVRRIPTYDTRSNAKFVVPKYYTSVGARRICVRGLKLFNQISSK